MQASLGGVPTHKHAPPRNTEGNLSTALVDFAETVAEQHSENMLQRISVLAEENKMVQEALGTDAGK